LSSSSIPFPQISPGFVQRLPLWNSSWVMKRPVSTTWITTSGFPAGGKSSHAPSMSMIP